MNHPYCVKVSFFSHFVYFIFLAWTKRPLNVLLITESTSSRLPQVNFFFNNFWCIFGEFTSPLVSPCSMYGCFAITFEGMIIFDSFFFIIILFVIARMNLKIGSISQLFINYWISLGHPLGQILKVSIYWVSVIHHHSIDLVELISNMYSFR